MQHTFSTSFTCIIIVMHRGGISTLSPIRHFWSPANKVIILCCCCSLHAVSSVHKLAVATSLHKSTRLMHSSHRYHWRHWCSSHKLASAAGICLRTGRPQSVTSNVVAQKVVQLREMVSFHAITGKIVVGASGRWCSDWWQSAVGFLVQLAVTQLHESSTKYARLRTTAAILDVLGMLLRRQDQFAVFAQTWTTAALIVLKSPTNTSRRWR